MKSMIVCYNNKCHKLVRFSNSYAGRIQDFSKFPDLTSTHDVAISSMFPTIKVRLCRACVRRAGYKIKKPVVKVKVTVEQTPAT